MTTRRFQDLGEGEKEGGVQLGSREKQINQAFKRRLPSALPEIRGRKLLYLPSSVWFPLCTTSKKKLEYHAPHSFFVSISLLREGCCCMLWPDLPIIQRREAYKKAKAFSLTNSRRLKKPPCTGLFFHTVEARQRMRQRAFRWQMRVCARKRLREIWCSGEEILRPRHHIIHYYFSVLRT